MKKTPLSWSKRANSDLLGIKQYIAQRDLQIARDYVRRLKVAVDRLRILPESGSMLPEFQTPELREVFYGPYRLIYRYRERRVVMLTVVHGARTLDLITLMD